MSEEMRIAQMHKPREQGDAVANERNGSQARIRRQEAAQARKEAFDALPEHEQLKRQKPRK